jgi:HAD superfamily hydrolase (TIGR01509 family)
MLWQRAYAALASDLGARLPTGFWEAIAGTTIEDSVAVLLRSLGRTRVHGAAGQLVAHAERMLDAGMTPPWRPGARDLLTAVHAAGVPTALVTTTWRTTATRIATAHGMTFDAIVCGDEVTPGKPAPDPYLEAACQLGVPPSDCVVVEDSPTGVVSAEAAGMAVFVVPSSAPIKPATRRRVTRSLVDTDTRALAELASISPYCSS